MFSTPRNTGSDIALRVASIHAPQRTRRRGDVVIAWAMGVVAMVGACVVGACEPVELDFKTVRSALTCSVVDQDCGGQAKCTLTGTDENASASCLDKSNGVLPLPVGSTCDRSGSGTDHCVKGSLCSAAGPEPLEGFDGTIPKSGTDAVKRCRRFCDDDTDCDQGLYCHGLQELAGTAGICIETCEVGDEACPYGFECGLVRTVTEGLVGACMPPGEREPGQVCDAANRCEQGLLCSGGAGSPGTCQALCEPRLDDAGTDDEHSRVGCEENYFCEPFRILTGQALAYCRVRLD